MAVGANKGKANKPPPKTTNGGEGEGEEEEEEEDADAAPVSKRELNSAITKAMKGFMSKKLPKLLETTISSVLAKKSEGGEGEGEEEEEEEQEEERAPGDRPTKPERPSKKPQAPAANAAPSPSDKKVAKLERKLAELEQREKDVLAKAARDEERNAVVNALTAQGVRKEAIGPLTTWLLSDDSGKLVRRDGEGKLVFMQGADQGEEGDELSIKDGLGGWLKSDAGKGYIAPKSVGGSGFQPPTLNRGTNSQRQPANGGQRDIAAQDNELWTSVMGVVGGGDLPQ